MSEDITQFIYNTLDEYIEERNRVAQVIETLIGIILSNPAIVDEQDAIKTFNYMVDQVGIKEQNAEYLQWSPGNGKWLEILPRFKNHNWERSADEQWNDD